MKIYIQLFLFLLVPTLAFSQSNKINISKDMLIALSTFDGDPMLMFDGNTDTEWFPGWNSLYYPASIIIDLKASNRLTKIRLYDGKGSHRIKIAAGSTPFQATELLNMSLDKYNEWREVSLNVMARYIVITIPIVKTASPPELEFYGTTSGPAPGPPVSFVMQNNVNGTFGVNSFHWVPNEVLGPFKYIREYQYWQWMEGAQDKVTFEPSRSGAGNFDTHYQTMKQEGFVVVPCINQTPEWFNTSKDPQFNQDWKPIAPGANPELPASYLRFAKFLFQLSARYGKKTIAPNLLTIDEEPFWTGSPANKKRSGLDLLEYIEVWNEPDKTWKGPQAYFSPYEFAAMMSAAYDGHCGTLGPNVGIKTANPDMKVVMGGLARLSIDYIKAMDLWFKQYRKDGKFASDVMNFHHYSNSVDIQSTAANSIGISPEADKLDEKLETIKRYVNTYFPGKEIWLSEYGYDTNNSTQRVPVTATLLTQEDAQAAWLVRSMLMIMKSNIDKAFLYSVTDTGTNPNGLYSRSGVVGHSSENYRKKKSWYHIQRLRETVEDFKLVSMTQTPVFMNFTFQKGAERRVFIVYAKGGKSEYQLDLTGTEISYFNRNEAAIQLKSTDYKKKFPIDEYPLIFSIK
ncbi:MAG: hypothetical protein K0R51_2266 [Cytophagaceae bacterium]|jgi:hypothetical protein|nr:hypothetical protein [Cytophagaceae bacterium]